MNKFKKFRKTTELYFGTEKYKLTRTNHLFETRAQDKQRDQFINEDRYKKIITLALQNGLKSFRAKGSVVVVIANSKRKNFSCTSILVCLDEKNNIFIITAIQTYGDNKWHRGFMKAPNRIIISPKTYVLEKMSEQELKEKVTLAAQLDATNIQVQTLNKRGRETERVKNIKKIAISFTIVKNITAQTGNKTLYIRIAKPDNEILTKNPGNQFKFEDRNISYSIKKYIEYTGEEQSVTVYWDVEEFLPAGTYHIYIFADGNMIGQGSFRMK
jgi:hypothetical protein